MIHAQYGVPFRAYYQGDTRMISIDELKKMAQLAHLDIGDDRLTTFQSQIDAILTHVSELNQFDAHLGLQPTTPPSPCLMRDDTPIQSTVSPELNAPKWEGGFSVPQLS